MSGAKIHNPCVNKSEFQTSLYGTDVFIGFQHLKGLERKIAELIVSNRVEFGKYRSIEEFIQRIPIGIETLQTLISIGAFRFTGKTKNELFIISRLIMMNFKPDSRSLLLLEEPVKEYKMPILNRSPLEDAFDEIELLTFPVSITPFNLLQTSYRGSVMAKDLKANHKKQVKMLAYLVSRKHVPTKLGDMYFGTWIDVNGEFFDTAHFADCLKLYPFQGGGCYLLLGVVEVDYHFPTITVIRMAKMPFIPDPRYSETDDKRFETQQQIREDVSMTSRDPYPQEHEIGLPRHKMKV